NGNTVSVVSGTSCNTAYRIKITLTSTSGLISTSCFKDVTVNDITPPTFTNCPADVVIECSGSSDAANTGTATATDNCSANVTFKDATTPGCYTLITRTWTATDPCGNTATCVQRIIKRDRTAPVITCPASGDATATDNCSATINIFFKDEGSTRTWTAVDESGNYSTCTQNTSAPRVAQTNVVQQAVAVEQTVKVDATKVPNLSSSSIKGVVKTDRLNVNAFPNPYTNEVNFRFTSPVSGKAILEVFDMTGRKLGVVYQGNINANIQKAINYKVPALNRGAMIYKFSVGNLKEHGSLLPTKQ
ncbi:MAG: hypothetical protein ABIN01_21765, partial [Ferruginibacter sp.]